MWILGTSEIKKQVHVYVLNLGAVCFPISFTPATKTRCEKKIKYTVAKLPEKNKRENSELVQ